MKVYPSRALSLSKCAATSIVTVVAVRSETVHREPSPLGKATRSDFSNIIVITNPLLVGEVICNKS